jgi:hypothetical protein
MCDAIVDGLAVLPPAKKKEKRKANSPSFREEASCATTARTGTGTEGEEGDDDDDDDDACGAVLALISVLGTMDASSTSEKQNDEDVDDDDDDDEDWRYHLPMLPSKKTTKRNNRKKGSSSSFAVVDCLGCELPPSTYKRLSKKGRDVVAFAISAAARAVAAANDEEEDEEEDERIVATMMMERIAPLLASIIMHALRRLEREGEKMLSSDDGDAHDSSSDVRCRADRDVLLILGLVSFVFVRSFVRLFVRSFVRSFVVP